MRALFLLFALGLVSVSGWADSAWEFNKLTKQARVDLNGDGKIENVRLEIFKKRYSGGLYPTSEYRLSVNNQSVWGKGAGEIYGFGLARVQKADRFKEIMVVSYEQESYTVDLFRFKGGKMRRVGRLDYGFPHFYGDGWVDSTGNVADFWGATKRYRMQRGHLRLVSGNIFPLAQKATLTKPLALYRTPASSKSFQLLPKGVHIIIAKYAFKERRYLIKAQGVRGWIKSDQIETMQGPQFAGRDLVVRGVGTRQSDAAQRRSNLAQ